MTAPTTAPAPGLSTAPAPLALMVFSKDQHKLYPIIFPNEAVALAWIESHPWTVDGVRSNTYLTGEADDLVDDGTVGPVNPDDHPTLYARLYPICEHGMDGNLCAGPGHYPSDNPW